MQGPKRPRRCTLPNLGGHPSCGIRCPLNPPNRRIRTRTYGGVGGEESRGSPLSRSRLKPRRLGEDRSSGDKRSFSGPHFGVHGPQFGEHPHASATHNRSEPFGDYRGIFGFSGSPGYRSPRQLYAGVEAHLRPGRALGRPCFRPRPIFDHIFAGTGKELDLCLARPVGTSLLNSGRR